MNRVSVSMMSEADLLVSVTSVTVGVVSGLVARSLWLASSEIYSRQKHEG